MYVGYHPTLPATVNRPQRQYFFIRTEFAGR